MLFSERARLLSHEQLERCNYCVGSRVHSGSRESRRAGGCCGCGSDEPQQSRGQEIYNELRIDSRKDSLTWLQNMSAYSAGLQLVTYSTSRWFNK